MLVSELQQSLRVHPVELTSKTACLSIMEGTLRGQDTGRCVFRVYFGGWAEFAMFNLYDTPAFFAASPGMVKLVILPDRSRTVS